MVHILSLAIVTPPDYKRYISRLRIPFHQKVSPSVIDFLRSTLRRLLSQVGRAPLRLADRPVGY
jgi:hypothetical protein